MRRRGTRNRTLVRLASLGDRLTHDSPARAAGFRSLHTHALTLGTHPLHSQLLCTDMPYIATRRTVMTPSPSPSTARSPHPPHSPSLRHRSSFIADPILALSLAWPIHPPRIGMLCCFCCWGPRFSRSPRLPPPVCPRPRIWSKQPCGSCHRQMNCWMTAFYAVAAVVDLPRWINTNAILRCHMRLFAYRAASSHISAHCQTRSLQPVFLP